MANKAAKWKKPKLPAARDVNSVAISRDGSKVVGATFFFNTGAAPLPKQIGFYAWDDSGTPLWMDEFQATAPPKDSDGKGKQGGIYSVAMSRDGAWAAGGGMFAPGQGLISAYNVATGNKGLTHHPPSMVIQVAINQNGKYLVAAADRVYVFARSGATWAQPVTTPAYANGVHRVAISATGDWIAAGAGGGRIVLIRNRIGSGGGLDIVGEWQAPAVAGDPTRNWILWVAMAAGGSAFAVACANGNVYYFDINALNPASFKPTWQEALPVCRACRSVAISDDGSLIAAAGSECDSNDKLTGRGKVFLLSKDVQDPVGQSRIVWTSATLTIDSPNLVSMDKAGDFVAVTDGTTDQRRGGYYLFSGADGTLHWTHPTKELNWPIALAADAGAAAAGSNDGRVGYFSVP